MGIKGKLPAAGNVLALRDKPYPGRLLQGSAGRGQEYYSTKRRLWKGKDPAAGAIRFRRLPVGSDPAGKEPDVSKAVPGGNGKHS